MEGGVLTLTVGLLDRFLQLAIHVCPFRVA